MAVHVCHVLSVTIRLDDAQVAQMDRIAAALKKRELGVDVTRSDVIRAVIRRGIKAFVEDYKLDSEAAE